MTITVRKRLAGVDDIYWADGGTNAEETFTYTPDDGPVLTITRPDATHLKFQKSIGGLAKSLEDLVDGGGDVPIVVDTFEAKGNSLIGGTLGVTGVATFTKIPVGPASDPATDNQLSRKKFVEDQDNLVKAGVQACSYSFAVDVGALNTYEATFTPAITSYTNGMFLILLPTNTNTSSTPTFNAGGGARTIVKGAAAALASGDIANGSFAMLQFNSSWNYWVLLNPISEIPNVKLTGDVEQYVYSTNSAMNDYYSTNATVAADTSAFTTSEGLEWTTLSITPKNAANILKIDAVILCAPNSVVGAAGLFVNSESSARAGAAQLGYGGYPTGPIVIGYDMVAGTTSAMTFRIRVGTTNASYAIHINGWSGVGSPYHLFGSGTQKSFFRITEIKG